MCRNVITNNTFGNVSKAYILHLMFLESNVLDVPVEFFSLNLVPFIQNDRVCHLKTFFHSSLASELITHMNIKIKNPWREFNTVKRMRNASRTPWGDRKVSIAKSQVRPKRNMTKPMPIIKRTILFPSTALSLPPVSFLSIALDLRFRTSTTSTQMKMTMLKTMTRRRGPRNEAQNAATWDKKQL